MKDIYMQNIKEYIGEILSTSLSVKPVQKSSLGRLPLYIGEAYRLYDAQIYDHPLMLVELKEDTGLSTGQIEKHLELISKALNKKVVLVANRMPALNRHRLIEKGVSFIVPGKQLFMPDMLLDLRENFVRAVNRKNNGKLLPSAQYILLYHLLHPHDKVPLTDLPFKAIAAKLGYTAMAITKAIDDLKSHALCQVVGTKEKYLRFAHERTELWEMSRPYLVNPVLKQVYVDKKPAVHLLQSNVSALPEYSNLNPDRQQYYAVGKTIYYELQKKGALVNENLEEGRYCVEAWKYDPVRLAKGIAKEGNVDPLSLYLSLKDRQDERIEMALDQIVKKYIW